MREVFTDKRVEIQDDVEKELRTLLGRDGIVVRSLYLGHVDLPAQYRQGLEGMLAEELATEKMRYTLQLKEKRVQETALEGDAAKVQRQKAAEAAGEEEIIAAKAREEAMKHVLPLKEKEIEQRRLEAEARKVQRVKDAEGDAEARKIETAAEADSRRTLSDADAYRIDVTGKANAAQLERDSVLIAKNPLLIQKTLADKLSDKIQVIVAPPSSGGFFAGGLLGMQGARARSRRGRLTRAASRRRRPSNMVAAVLLVAIVAEDPAVLRNAPRDDAPAQASLWRGDWLEVRGETAGFLKVYDHRHERPGYIRPSIVRLHRLDEASAPELASVVRFLRDAGGSESLGIGYAALFLRAAPAGADATEIFAAIGTMADRLARRASGRKTTLRDAALAGHLEVAAELRRCASSRSTAIRRTGAARLCYDGEAWARVLATPGAPPVEKARAALFLASTRCQPVILPPAKQRAFNDRAARRRSATSIPRRSRPWLGGRVRLARAEALAWRAFDERAAAAPPMQPRRTRPPPSRSSRSPTAACSRPRISPATTRPRCASPPDAGRASPRRATRASAPSRS